MSFLWCFNPSFFLSASYWVLLWHWLRLSLKSFSDIRIAKQYFAQGWKSLRSILIWSNLFLYHHCLFILHNYFSPLETLLHIHEYNSICSFVFPAILILFVCHFSHLNSFLLHVGSLELYIVFDIKSSQYLLLHQYLVPSPGNGSAPTKGCIYLLGLYGLCTLWCFWEEIHSSFSLYQLQDEEEPSEKSEISESRNVVL